MARWRERGVDLDMEDLRSRLRAGRQRGWISTTAVEESGVVRRLLTTLTQKYRTAHEGAALLSEARKQIQDEYAVQIANASYSQLKIYAEDVGIWSDWVEEQVVQKRGW